MSRTGVGGMGGIPQCSKANQAILKLWDIHQLCDVRLWRLRERKHLPQSSSQPYHGSTQLSGMGLHHSWYVIEPVL